MDCHCIVIAHLSESKGRACFEAFPCFCEDVHGRASSGSARKCPIGPDIFNLVYAKGSTSCTAVGRSQGRIYVFSSQNCHVQQLLEKKKNFQPSMTFDTKEQDNPRLHHSFIKVNLLMPNYALWISGTKSKSIQPTRSK